MNKISDSMVRPAVYVVRLVLLFVIAVLAGQQIGQAQPVNTTAKAAELATQAEKLALDGKTQEALAIITSSLKATPQADPKVKLRLLFTAAWLEQQLAEQSPDSRRDWLKRASATYSQILMIPGYEKHRQTRENLSIVMQQLGLVDNAVKLLTTDDKNAKPRDRYEHILRAGDLLAQSGKFNEAFGYYKTAQDQMPNDSAASWKIVGIFPQLPDIKPLYSMCEDWIQRGQVNVGARGLETLVVRNSGDSEATQRQALVRWVEIEGNRKSLTVKRIRALQRRGKLFHKEMDELIGFAEGKLPKPDTNLSIYFWTNDTLRRHALATAMRSFAAARAADKAIGEAEELLRKGVYRLAPDAHNYRDGRVLHGRSIVGLDLALDLAMLYRLSPSLDRNGRRFGELEDRLLSQKNQAYHASQPKAILKFHTVLGLIYADRGKWQDSGWRAAPYHLERAVSTAQEIAGRDSDEYQPLPHLTYLHASAIKGRPGATRESKKLFVDAAKGFLDLNDLSQAGAALANAKSQPDTAVNQEVNVLQQVLDVRSKVNSVDIKAIPAGERDLWINKEVEFIKLDQGVLDPVFLRRQRAKLWSDFGTKFEKSDLKEIDRLDKGVLYYNKSFDELKKGGVITYNDLKTIVDPNVLAERNMFENPGVRLDDKQSLDRTISPKKVDSIKIENSKRFRRK